MTTERLLTSLRRRWHLCLACLLVGAALGVAALQLLPPTYQARTQVLIEVATDGAASRSDDAAYVQQSMPTLLQFARSTTIVEDIRTRTASDASAAELGERLSFTVPEDTTVVEIQATGPTAQQAASLAEAAAESVISGVTSQAGGLAGLRADVLQPATAPTAPISPDPLTLLPAGVIGGALLGVLLPLLLAVRDRNSRDLDEIEEAVGAPVVGVLAPVVPTHLAQELRSRAIATTLPRIFSTLGLGDHRASQQILPVCPAHAGVDAGFVAAGLVRTARASGLRAALVLNDTSLSRARTSALVAGGLEDLTISGPRRSPGAVLTSSALTETLTHVPDRTELVVILCGVIDEDPDVRATLELATGVLLVADLAPPTAHLHAAVHSAAGADARIDGVVLCDTAPAARAAQTNQTGQATQIGQTAEPTQVDLHLPAPTRERSAL